MGEMLRDVFSNHYEVVDEFTSEKRVVANEALYLLAKLTVSEKIICLKNYKRFLKMKPKLIKCKSLQELNKSNRLCIPSSAVIEITNLMTEWLMEVSNSIICHLKTWFRYLLC